MNKIEILTTLEMLASQNGLYERLLKGWQRCGILNEVLEELERIGFDTPIDLIIYFEC